MIDYDTMRYDKKDTQGTETITAAFAELVSKYTAAREEWIAKLGADFDEAQFHAWFTLQVTSAR